MRYKGLALKAWGRRVLVKALAEKFTCLKKQVLKKTKEVPFLSSKTIDIYFPISKYNLYRITLKFLCKKY